MFTLAFSVYPLKQRFSIAHKHCEIQGKTKSFSSFLTRSLCADSKCTECWVKHQFTGPSSLTVLSHFHKHYLFNLDSSSHLSNMLYYGVICLSKDYLCLSVYTSKRTDVILKVSGKWQVSIEDLSTQVDNNKVETNMGSGKRFDPEASKLVAALTPS